MDQAKNTLAGAAPRAGEQGDDFFWGVDQREARTLPAGMLADGENVRFDELVAQTRRGVLKPIWANRVNPGLSGRVNPWGKIYGAEVFRDPNGVESLLVAADGGLWRCVAFNAPVPVPLPTGVGLWGPVVLVQAFDAMWLFRGRELAPVVLRSFDGVTDVVAHWAAATTYHSGDEVAFGPWQNVTSITRVGQVATVVLGSAHGFITGADVEVRKATQTEYNGRFNITVVDEVTFTYVVTGSPATPATTGSTIQVSNMLQYWKAVVATVTAGVGHAPDTEPASWTRVYNVLPNADTALYLNNRLLVPTAYQPASSDNYATFNGGLYAKVDYVVATDFLDDVHFDFSNEFRINQGSADEIVDLAKFNSTTVVIWKGSSWYLVSNVGASLTSLSLDMQSDQYGLCARGAWAVCGSDLIFMASRRGLVSIKQTDQAKSVGVDLPLSAPLVKLIGAIDWSAGDGIRLASWANKLYVGVPLRDRGQAGGSGNNAVLVYDFLAGVRGNNNYTFNLTLNAYGWTPVDRGSALVPAGWVKMMVNGAERLLFWGTDGFVNEMEGSDWGDQVADGASATGLGWEAIRTRVLTRGYFRSVKGMVGTTEGSVALQWWGPSYGVTVWQSGVNRGTVCVAAETKDRTRYVRPWDAGVWDATNAGDDHGAANREDYSVVLPNGGMFLGTNGVVLNRFQEGLETFRVKGRAGRSFQMELVNTTGRVRVLATRIEGVPGRERKGTQS